MPVGPNDLKALTEQEKETLNQAYAIIDDRLTSHFGGQDKYLSTEILPALNGKQKEELIKAYLQAGWKHVRFDSDRDGKFLYLSK